MAGRFSRCRYATVHNTRRSPVTFNFAAGPFDTFWFAIYDHVRYPPGDRPPTPLARTLCPSRPRPMICASFSVTFFLSYRYFYHYLCSPMLSPGIYAGWIIIRGFLRLADAKCCSLFASWKMDSVRQFNATQLGGIFVTDFVCIENKIPMFEIIVVICGIVYTDFN